MASADLQPGDRLQHKDGAVVTLNCRKRPDDGRSTTPYHDGWWLMDGGGLADFVIDQPESDWRLIDGSACGPVGSTAPADPHKTGFDTDRP